MDQNLSKNVSIRLVEFKSDLGEGTHSSVGIGQNIVLRLFEKASISLANVYPKAFAFLKEKIITQK